MSTLIQNAFNEEVHALLQDIQIQVEGEVASTIKQLDLQFNDPSEAVDPDDFLEGVVAALQWVSVKLDERMKEL